MTTWRQRLAEWIAWLLGRLVPPAPPTRLEQRTLQLVVGADQLNASGPYKKWQIVAARLQKEFPGTSLRVINLKIEEAVNRRAWIR